MFAICSSGEARAESEGGSHKSGVEFREMVQAGPEQPLEVFLEVMEESEPMEGNVPTGSSLKDNLDIEIRTPGRRMLVEEDNVVGTTEYAISQVVSGDIPHSFSESSGTLATSKVQSASVTLFDSAHMDSIVQYAKQSSVNHASRKFKVPGTTIKKWMNAGEESSGMVSRSKFNSPGQGRKLSYSQNIDDKIASHIRDLQSKGEKVSLQYVCTYAKSLIREENPNFVASSGWAQRFLVRHAIELSFLKPVKLKPGSSPESGRGRPLSYSPATDKAIADHVKGLLADGQQVTNSELRRYAKDMICKENPSFTGSASWAQNFLLRHKIALQSFPSNTSFSLNSSTPSSPKPASNSMLSSTSTASPPPPSLSDPPLMAAEITPASGSSGPIYSDASIGSMESAAEDPMKTALTLLTGENIDLTMLSTAQVAALQNSLSELTADAVSLVDLLNTGSSVQGGTGSHSRHDGSESTNGADQGEALIASGLESPTSGNVYLNLGGGEGFGSVLIGLSSSQSTPPTSGKPVTTTAASTATSSGGFTTEVVAQGSRPLSYAVETDQALANWVHDQQASGKRVTFASLRAYAKQLIASENPNFNASVGWVTPFLLRHNLDLSVNRKVRSSHCESQHHRVPSPSRDKLKEREERQPTKEPSRGGKPEETSVLNDSRADQENGLQQAQTETPASLSNSVLEQATVTPVITEVPLVVPQESPANMLTERLSVNGDDQGSDDKLAGSSPVRQGSPGLVADLTPAKSKDQEDAEKTTSRKSQRNEKTRTRHTLAEKLEVVQLMKEYGVAAHYVCRMLGIANSTFAGWTKLVQQKGPELQALSANKKRANVSGQGRPLSYPRDKDEQIARWVRERQQMLLSVSPSDLSKHATYIISQENPNFTASSGWQQKFLQRHNIQLSSSWVQKPPTSSSPTSVMHEEDRVTSMSSPVLEDSQNIPTAVQTEEVSSNEYASVDSRQSFSYSESLEEELVEWVKHKKKTKDGPSVQVLCKKAEELITKEDQTFVATLGWAFRFLHRHLIMLDSKQPSSLAGGIAESSRKRPLQETSDAISKYLHTPKKVRQLDQSAPVTSSGTPVSAATQPIIIAPELSMSPSTGNLCEALLALSNQAMVEGEPALQAAMQNLQNAMQQALKQQQLHLQQQQQQQQQKQGGCGDQQLQQKRNALEDSGDADEKMVEQSEKLPEGQSSAPSSVSAAMVASSLGTPYKKSAAVATAGAATATATTKIPASIVGVPTERVTPYNNYFGKPAREFSPEEKEEVVRYANATTLLKAALKYGVAAPTVWRWRVELKLHQPKYTSMQKKYIIKFAETNSLKEASHRYGITSKTIQNWRKALQSDGDVLSMAGPSSEEVLPLVSHATDQMLEASPSLSKVTASHDSEVVAYDSHNFQFIVDGGEVTDLSGRGDHEIGGDHAPTTPLRVDPVPLEVTNEVDIENVGMEYDVISSEGHAAKPRCTTEEKAQILQYAIEHSVREASQKYGISPGTLYYWKKTNLSGAAGTGPLGGSSAPVVETGGVVSDESSMVMSCYPGTSTLLEQIQAASTSAIGGHQQGREEVEKVVGEQYLSSTSDVASTSLSGSDVNLLHAVSSFLNPADGTIVTSSHADLSQPVIAHSSSINGGISSPTEVLVAPLQVASEEVATVVEEEVEEGENGVIPLAASVDGDGAVENVVVVEVEPKTQDGVMALIQVDKADLEVKTTDEVEVEQDSEQELQSEVGQELAQELHTENEQ